jgi:hypothetical protein
MLLPWRTHRGWWRQRPWKRHIDQALDDIGGAADLDAQANQQRKCEGALDEDDRGERSEALSRSNRSLSLCIGGHSQGPLAMAQR